MAHLELTFVNETEQPISQHDISNTLELILRRLGHVGRVNIELIIVGDKKITALNHQFREINKPTDVLSFPEPKAPNSDLLGSVVISADTADRQAKEAGISLLEEIKVLAGHGFLHLLGYHHR